MNKPNQFVLLLFLALTILSCDKKSISNVLENEVFEAIEPGILSSINLERISCNVTSATVNFSEQEITDVQYSSGAKTEFTYTNGLLAERLEYHINGFLLFSYAYVYDANGRLLEISRTTNYNNPQVTQDWASVVVSQFSYANSNYITRKEFWYEADEQLSDTNSEATQYYFLNNQQLISKYETVGWYEDYNYTNNNPSVIQNSVNDESMFMTHFNGVNLSGYHLQEFLFGEHWKNNSKLAFFNILVGRTIVELTGEDLLRSYDVYDANGNLTESLNVEYEVDVQGRLKKQYREFTNYGSPYYENVTYVFDN